MVAKTVQYTSIKMLVEVEFQTSYFIENHNKLEILNVCLTTSNTSSGVTILKAVNSKMKHAK